MPTYQYRCTECGNELEAVQKFTDPSLTECPECAGRLRKIYNAVGVVFKGSGFYRTDSRTDAKSGSTHSGSKGSESSSGSSASEKKSDSGNSGSGTNGSGTSGSGSGGSGSSGTSSGASSKKAASTSGAASNS